MEGKQMEKTIRWVINNILATAKRPFQYLVVATTSSV